MARKKKTPCEIPEPASVAAIQHVTLKDPDHQRDQISEYLEWQINKGANTEYKVTHLERMKSEVVFGEEYVAWDVHTDEPGRWWVITNPTNLYSQREFPSLDYTFSFHIGVMARVASRNAKQAPDQHKDRLRATWRRWETAIEAVETAREAEDFQAVGMRCREALVSLVKALQKDVPIADGAERPKAADFVNWFVHISNHLAPGPRNEHVRSYLKSASKETWQLVNWVTHTSQARFYEAQLSLHATTNLLRFVSSVVTHAESDPPSSCPECHSYRIAAVFDPEVDRDPPYVSLCESCGWNDADDNSGEEVSHESATH